MWDALIQAADRVEFEPPDPHLDVKGFYEIAWRASSIGRPVSVMYTARVNPEQRAFESASRSRFLAGELDPRRLYVVPDGCAPAGVDPARIRLLDQIMVIPPAGAAHPFPLPPAPLTPPSPIGRVVGLSDDPSDFRCTLGTGWSAAEGWAAWSDGGVPDLILRLGHRPAQDLVLTMVAQGEPLTGQGVSVIVGGQTVARLRLAREPGEFRFRVPRALIPGPVLRLTLKIDPPEAPGASDHSGERRLLRIGLSSIRLDLAQTNS
jgi:hypothetical protein